MTLQENNHRCLVYDRDYDGRFMDILSPEGYVHALFQVLQIKPGGSCTLAPVCSSFVWMSLVGFKQMLNAPIPSSPTKNVRMVSIGNC